MNTHEKVLGVNPLQEALFYIDPAERRLMTESWNKKNKEKDLRTLKGQKKALRRIEVIVAKSQESGITWSNIEKLLALPLGIYQASDLDVQPAVDAEVFPFEQTQNNSEEEKIVWTETAMREMHEGLLNYRLQLLRSKGNAEEKIETLHWIWSKDVRGFDTKTVGCVTKNIPIRADQLAFTFQTCCRLSGYHYDELRDGLAWELRSSLAKLGFQIRN